jgi:pilus assembly protein CpaE
VLAPSGGSGASTLAAGISTALAQHHGQAGLIDLRLGVADQTAMFNLRPARTLATCAITWPGWITPVRTVLDPARQRCPSAGGAGCIDRGGSGDRERRPAGAGFGPCAVPCVVVDMSNVLTPEQVEVLWQADLILLVARLDYTSVRNTRRTIDTMAELGIGRDRMKLVLNACGQRRQLEVKQAEEAIGIKAAQCIPYEPAAVHRP